ASRSASGRSAWAPKRTTTSSFAGRPRRTPSLFPGSRTSMDIHINHFSLGARNSFESAARLRRETGLGFWTGEWLRDICCHMVPLGNGPHGKDAFIEIQCSVDAHAFLKSTQPNYRYDVLAVDNEHNGD